MFSEMLEMILNHDTRKIARYDSEDLKISTAELSDGERPYETAVRHREYNSFEWIVVDAYDTKEEAEVGHKQWVKIMTAKKLPDELRDCQNAEISKIISKEHLIFKREATHANKNKNSIIQ